MGRYVFADFCSGRIWTVPADLAAGAIPIGGTLPEPLDTQLLINSFGVDGTGEILTWSTGWARSITSWSHRPTSAADRIASRAVMLVVAPRESADQVKGRMGRRRTAVAALMALGAALALAIPAAGGPAPGAGLRVERILGGYEQPLQVVGSPAGRRLYIVEQTGRIRLASRATTSDPWVRDGVFLDLHKRVAGPFVGRGLLGMVLDPGYATVFGASTSSTPNEAPIRHCTARS